MRKPALKAAKFTKLELQIMQALWDRKAASIREIQEAFPEENMPSYTTVQTTVYRLEGKNAVRRVKKISNAHIFEAVVSRDAAQRRLMDEVWSFFGGRTQPVMAHLVESGKLTLEDVKEAEKALRRLSKRRRGDDSGCEPFVAIDRVSGSCGTVGVCPAIEPCTNSLLDLADRFSEISDSILASHRNWQSCGMAKCARAAAPPALS